MEHLSNHTYSHNLNLRDWEDVKSLWGRNGGPTLWHNQQHSTVSQSRAIPSQRPKCVNLPQRENKSNYLIWLITWRIYWGFAFCWEFISRICHFYRIGFSRRKCVFFLNIGARLFQQQTLREVLPNFWLKKAISSNVACTILELLRKMYKLGIIYFD